VAAGRSVEPPDVPSGVPRPAGRMVLSQNNSADALVVGAIEESFPDPCPRRIFCPSEVSGGPWWAALE
jgi:hypothetical protein